jgi:rare lipoprotein A
MRAGVAFPSARTLPRALAAVSLAWLATACSTSGPPSAPPATPAARAPASKPPAAPAAPPATGSSRRGGGYYMDDGPGEAPAAGLLAAVPDAEPRAEPLHRFANSPYVVFGRTYVPQRELQPFRQRGHGSWYGRKFHGQPTATGEIYDMYAMTAAHPTLPLPSYARVTNVANGRSVIVRVNDRGPFLNERVIDLSYTAAWKLGYVEQGFAQVEVETIVPGTMTARRPTLGEVSAAASPPRARMTLPPPQPAAGAPMPASAATESATTTASAARSEPPATAAVGVSAAGASVAATGTNGTAAASATAAALPSPPVAPAATVAAAPAARETPPPLPLAPVAQEANGVFLQLGAFSGKENAEAFRVHITRMLPWIGDAVTLRSKQGLVRVQLGPYADAIEAMAVAERIRDTLDVRPVLAR